jgi:hypothetical protein
MARSDSPWRDEARHPSICSRVIFVSPGPVCVGPGNHSSRSSVSANTRSQQVRLDAIMPRNPSRARRGPSRSISGSRMSCSDAIRSAARPIWFDGLLTLAIGGSGSGCRKTTCAHWFQTGDQSYDASRSIMPPRKFQGFSRRHPGESGYEKGAQRDRNQTEPANRWADQAPF